MFGDKPHRLAAMACKEAAPVMGLLTCDRDVSLGQVV